MLSFRAAIQPKEGEGGAGGFRVEAARRDRAAASLAQIEEIDLAAGGSWGEAMLLYWPGSVRLDGWFGGPGGGLGSM